jgi:hypothetical protein
VGAIQNGRLETGSNNNFARIIDRNVMSSANTMFPRVSNKVDRQKTLNTSSVQVKSNMDAQKPEIVEYTLMQLLLGVGRRSIVSATLENMVLASEIAYLSIIHAKLLLLPVSSWPFCIAPRSSWYSVSVNVPLCWRPLKTWY